MKRTLLYGADDWGDDEPDPPSPRKINKELHYGTILIIGFTCGYLFRSFLN